MSKNGSHDRIKWVRKSKDWSPKECQLTCQNLRWFHFQSSSCLACWRFLLGRYSTSTVATFSWKNSTTVTRGGTASKLQYTSRRHRGDVLISFSYVLRCNCKAGHLFPADPSNKFHYLLTEAIMENNVHSVFKNCLLSKLGQENRTK